MLGHEGVRRYTEDHLKMVLPVKLDEIRERTPPVEVEHEPDVWPKNPHVSCADEFPTKSDKLPSVIVTSAQLLSMSAEEAGSATEWDCIYQLDLACCVVSPQAGGVTLASVGRDRILLALREICLQTPQVGPRVRIVAGDATEETGPAKEDAAARPMSVGLITVRIEATETLTEHYTPVEDLTFTVLPHDSITNPIPTT